VWDYPQWSTLPAAASGTWVEAPAETVHQGFDLQLLAVRFVDPGHPEQQLGTRFRMWVRNNSEEPIEQPFNVVAMASNSRDPQADLPQAGVRIEKIAAGEIQAVDVRLPVEANTMTRDEEGNSVPFQFLHLIADSDREITEVFEGNNGAVLDRQDILPVDPALFAAEAEQAGNGALVNLAGEGFGPEAGQVLVNVGDVELQAEILGWYDLGVQLRLPRFAPTAETPAELIVVRGDQAASNPLTVSINSSGLVAQASVSQLP
jgi:hypothetical protein